MHNNAIITRIALTILVLTSLVISYKLGGHFAYAEIQPEINKAAYNLIRAEGQMDMCRDIINGLSSEGKLFVINAGG